MTLLLFLGFVPFTVGVIVFLDGLFPSGSDREVSHIHSFAGILLIVLAFAVFYIVDDAFPSPGVSFCPDEERTYSNRSYYCGGKEFTCNENNCFYVEKKGGLE